jgi:hypothetical protein
MVHGPSFRKLFVVRCWENIWPLDGDKLPEPGDSCIMRTFTYPLKHVIEGNIAEMRRRGKRLRSYWTALRRREMLEFERWSTKLHCVENWLGRWYGPVVRQTYLLTPWSRVLLEKLTGLQLVKKFPAFYGTRKFITAFTSTLHMSVSWASSI